MKTSTSLRRARIRRVTLLSLLALAPLAVRASGSFDPADSIVAVCSKASPNYHREQRADGSFAPETYTFGEGGLQRSGMADPSLEHLRFNDVARIVAPALASKNFVAWDGNDLREAQLLIMVYWGATNGTDDRAASPEYRIAQSLQPPPLAPMGPPPNGISDWGMRSDPDISGRQQQAQMDAAVQQANDAALQHSMMLAHLANVQRDRQDARNAALLGYDSELERVRDYSTPGLAQRRQDIIDEIEESRYYVVLLAYEFQPLLQHKEKRLVWQTRFSIRERHNDLAAQLAAMVRSAAPYFGQNSAGLVRTPALTPHVELGDLRIRSTP